MILSFGGIPLLYYGDEIGTLNDGTFLQDERKARDNRWMHRPRIDWEKAEKRHEHGAVENRIFEGLRKLIAVRKTIPAFADFNNRELLTVDNEHLFAFLRSHPQKPGRRCWSLAISIPTRSIWIFPIWETGASFNTARSGSCQRRVAFHVQ